MAQENNVIETRSITSEEAEICAKEQVQFIGNVQPHGFVFIVDTITYQIVQCSDNALSLINQDIEVPLAKNIKPIGSKLSDWIEITKPVLMQDFLLNTAQEFKLNKSGVLNSLGWECLCTLIHQGKYASFEFFPTTSKFDSYSLLINLDKMVTKIRTCDRLDQLFNTLTNEFQRHAGYDRVMLYKFLPDWSGEVIAESVSKRTSVKYVGMRFPAEDIPKAARDLYRSSTIRVMADVDAEPAQLIPKTLPNGEILDQSQSILRGMSKFHVAYLQNMGVKASMSISLMSRGKLWGLVALHHYAPKVPPNHLVLEMKASCELFADIVISHMTPALDLDAMKQNLKRSQHIENTFRQLKIGRDDSSSLYKALEGLCEKIDKELIGICLEKECFIAQKDHVQQLELDLCESIAALIQKSDVEYYFESNSLLNPKQLTPLPGIENMAGICVFASSVIPELYVFFAAGEVEKQISWGGKPDTINIVVNNGARELKPRSSFAEWRQQVKGHCDEWRDKDRELLKILLSAVEHFVYLNKSERLKQSLHSSSFNDSLTGLPNRRYLTSYMQNLAANEAGSECNITMFFLDLDEFKRINDFLGHHTGDRLLQVISERLLQVVRAQDFVARLGGDEFVVVLANNFDDHEKNQVQAKRIANAIIESIAEPVFDGEHPMVTTVSIGALMCNYNELSFEEMLKRADIAMYQAKNAGKNKVHFFTPEDQDMINQQVKLEINLRDLLKNQGINVYYQPKIDKDGKVIGAEALARWQHHELGFIPPDAFIPLAEKNNLIVSLGEQVLDKACAQLAHWKQNSNMMHFRNLAINVSPLQLLSPSFEKRVLKIISKHNIENSMIRFEITETCFMQNFTTGINVLRSLRNAGISISLDDFGTGFSSLSYLWKLPIDEVKIDRSFIRNINTNNDSLTLVEGIINLCKKLNLEIVAEGVEDKTQLAILKGLECDSFQGFYYQKPASAKDFRFIASR